MVDAHVSREIPLTPVRSSSDNSGLVSNYSEASVPNDSSVASGVAPGTVPPSPQRSYQNSANSSPSSVNRSVANLSPVPVRTPVRMPSQATPMQPELQSPQPQFGGPQVGDLLGDYSEQRPHFSPQPTQGEPRVLYTSDDEDTDPTSANGSDYPAFSYTRNDATSTFGRVIQPFKDRMNNASTQLGSDEEEEASMPKGAIIFGYLQKQGRNGKWQTRWFESDGKGLTYYKTSKRIKLLATLDLAKVGSIKVNSQDQKGCSFTINISQRPYHLKADSKESCKDWVITLNRIKEARLHQGNVKLVNSQPPDLLDSVAPGVVVEAGRQRTHAVDDDDIVNWESSSWNGNPANEDTSFLQHSSSAKWQKSTRKLTKFASKVLRWARSIRKLGCIDAQNQVMLDHHVHPPGHDDYSRRRSGATKKDRPSESTKIPGRVAGTSVSSNASNEELSISRSMSIDDSRVLS